MSKHEAVDRLMAMATEKRADRTPPVAGSKASEEEATGIAEAASATIPASALAGSSSGSAPTIDAIDPLRDPERDSQRDPGSHPGANRNATALATSSNALNRGRQLMQAIRPLLPAIAGAMRLIDHGAVQAAARLLPLLGGSPGPSAPSAAAVAATNAAQEQFTRGALELEAAHAEVRQQLSALELKAIATEEQIGRLRTQLERLSSEQLATRTESHRLSDRVRLLTAGTIILLMLVIAQTILLAVTFHR